MAKLAPQSLLWRIGLSIMLAQVLIATAFGVYGYVRMRDFYYQQTLDNLTRVNALLASRYAVWMADGPAELAANVRDDAQLIGARITVVDPEGVVLAESHADPSAMENHRYRTEINEAFEHGVGNERRYSRTVDERMFYHAVRVDDADGHAIGVVRVSRPLTEVDGTFAQMTRVVGFAGAATILLTFAVVYLISHHISRQVSDVASAAARFADGELTHRIHQLPSSELAKLGESLNAMASQMARRMQQIEQQERETRAILQSMSAGVIALDADQRIININRAARDMFGLAGADPIGRLLQEVVREPAIHRFIDRAITAGDMAPVEYEQRTGGPVGRTQVSGEILRDADGQPRGMLVMLQDVTRLRQLESMRSDFAANVSHELRTPITNIKGYVETMLEVGVDDREQAARFLTIVKQNSDRLASIVEDVLALTRLEDERAAGAIELVETPLAGIVRSVVQQFADRAAAKPITIETDLPEGPSAWAHAPLIEQAVSNLLSNAINYSPPRTTVWISIGRGKREDEVVIEVRDQGPGIHADHIPRLFERFYRVDKGRSRELGGTGLGLAIVKHIMNVHQGRIEVESKVGSGSVFRLVLKRAGDDAERKMSA